MGLLSALLAFVGMAAAQGTPAPNPIPEANGSGTRPFRSTSHPRWRTILTTLRPRSLLLPSLSPTPAVLHQTGSVTFTDESSGTELPGSPVQLDGTGTAALDVTSGLAVGGNNIQAAYSGDANYAANNSQVVVVTLEKSTTTLTVTPATTAPAAGADFSVSVSIVAGTPASG